MAKKRTSGLRQCIADGCGRKLRGQSKYAKQYCEEHLQNYDTTKENTPAVPRLVVKIQHTKMAIVIHAVRLLRIMFHLEWIGYGEKIC